MTKRKKKDSWVLDVQEDENGDAVLEFPPDLLERAGWQEGDCLQWRDLGDGTWSLSKSDSAEDDSWDDVFRNRHRSRKEDDDDVTARVTLTRDVIDRLGKLMEATDLDSVDIVVSGASGIGPTIKIEFQGEIDATDYGSW
jgi:hypothetical protein